MKQKSLKVESPLSVLLPAELSSYFVDLNYPNSASKQLKVKSWGPVLCNYLVVWWAIIGALTPLCKTCKWTDMPIYPWTKCIYSRSCNIKVMKLTASTAENLLCNDCLWTDMPSPPCAFAADNATSRLWNQLHPQHTTCFAINVSQNKPIICTSTCKQTRCGTSKIRPCCTGARSKETEFNIKFQ